MWISKAEYQRNMNLSAWMDCINNAMKLTNSEVVALRSDMEKKLNVVLAHISETSGVDTSLVREDITHAANRVIGIEQRLLILVDVLGQKGKEKVLKSRLENGLKKLVLKRKLGR